MQSREGTPAASPTPPPLTQTDTGIWELPIAQYRMPGSGSPQNPSTIVDRRFAVPVSGVPRVDTLVSIIDQGQYRGLPATPLALTSALVTPERDGILVMELHMQMVCPGIGSAIVSIVIGSKARTLTFHSQSQVGESSISGTVRQNVVAGAPLTWYVAANSATNGYTVVAGAMNIQLDLLS